MFPGLTMAYWLTLHGLVTVLAVLIYVITSQLLQQRRHPSAAIAWVLFILLMPYLALPAFLTFGSRKQVRPRAKTSLLGATTAAGEHSWPQRTAVALGQPEAAPYETLQLHADGSAALAALWQVINGAKHSIEVCTFIVGDDPLGAQVVERLASKARAGVRVRLLLDGMGRWMGGRPDLKPLAAAGVELTLFVPPLHSPLKGRTNLRNHRKLVLADAAYEGRRLWSGGRNLAWEYFEGSADQQAWHDLSFDLRGALVQQAASLFERDWAFANGLKAVPAAQAASARAKPRAPATPPARRAQLVASGPDQVDDTVHALLITAAYRAGHRLQLVSPYFVPDSALLTALCLAARRGVEVDLLLPRRSNHRLSDLARRRALLSLSDAGGRVWLTPHMLHAKLAVIDNVVAYTGTANLDSRSLFLNYELMFAFEERDAVAACAAWFEHERSLAARHLPVRPGLWGDLADGLVLGLGFQL
jgi:cardiolipin synthase